MRQSFPQRLRVYKDLYQESLGLGPCRGRVSGSATWRSRACSSPVMERGLPPLLHVLPAHDAL